MGRGIRFGVPDWVGHFSDVLTIFWDSVCLPVQMISDHSRVLQEPKHLLNRSPRSLWTGNFACHDHRLSQEGS